MRSSLTIRGHPIHPMLVSLPIGLFAWTFTADIIYLLSDRDQFWYDIALWTGVAAVIAAVVAAVPGFVDYVKVVRGTDAVGMGAAHMALTLATTGLFIVAAAVMWDEGATEGMELGLVVALHGTGVATLAVAGWLGGEMVFRKHIGVVPRDEPEG